MRYKLIFSILASFALVLSCSRTEFAEHRQIGQINVSVPSGSVTRAAADSDATGQYADRCRLQVWLKDSLCFDKTVHVENMHAWFFVHLEENPDYTFLFWADNSEGDYYDTDDLRCVRFSSDYYGNDDRRDAFCRCLSGPEVKQMGEEWIWLTRPFGQVNVITDDAGDLFARSLYDEYTFAGSFFPQDVTVSFRAPSVYDVSTGTVSEFREFKYSAPVYCLDRISMEDGKENTLVMDYILAPQEKSVFDMQVTLSNPIDAFTLNLTNLPIQRNYRTNVRGSLLSGDVTAKVSIDSEWLGEFDWPYN